MNSSNLIYHAHRSFNNNEKNTDNSFFLNFLRALNNLTNNTYYIFDYIRTKLIYPDNMIVFLEHKFSLVNQGYQFYESHVHPEDLDMLEQINNVAFDFFYTLKQEQRKHVTIVYDIRLKEISGKYILVNHHLTPLTLADDGKIETALCMISPASNQYPGNVYIRNIKTKTIIEYNPKLNYFGEITHQNLTRQQCSMLEQIAKGHTESQIAELFNISINTVKSHKKDIFKKLSIFNIAAVLQWFNNQKKI